MTQDVERNRSAILGVAARHGARNVRVFGSVARGDDRPGSDIDLLVEMASDRSLLDLVALEQELETLLRRPVDVVTEESLAPSIRQRIAAQAQILGRPTCCISATSTRRSSTSERTQSPAGGAFVADRMRQDAIIRKLEVIGEAVKQLSEATRNRRAEIPWRQIAGMRDRVTHAYFGVDLGLVWRVVERDLAPLDSAVLELLETSTDG